MATSADNRSLIDPSNLIVVTATELETRAVRSAAPHLQVVEAGVGCSSPRFTTEWIENTVVTCGLAGGLRADLPTGTIVVPKYVLTPTGDRIECDAELGEALAKAALRFASSVERGPLVTCATLVTGAARGTWANRGYVAADMETGVVKAQRLASVRVILDTPARELSEGWLHPAAALVRPQLWPQALWLAREGPRCARLAAQVLAAAFE